MVHIVRLNKSGGTIVISLPAPIRDAMHIGRGDQLLVTVEDGRIVMVKVEGTTVSRLTGAITEVKT